VSPLRLGFAPNTSVLPSNTCSMPFRVMNSTSSIMELDCSLRVLRTSMPLISRSVSMSGDWSTRGICRLSIFTPSSISYCLSSYMSSSKSDRRHCSANGLDWKCLADISLGYCPSILLTACVLSCYISLNKGTYGLRLLFMLIEDRGLCFVVLLRDDFLLNDLLLVLLLLDDWCSNSRSARLYLESSSLSSDSSSDLAYGASFN